LLAENLRVLRIFCVVQPALHVHLASGNSEIAKHKHGRADWRIAPGVERDLLWKTRSLRRIKAFSHQREQSRIVQVIPERVIENADQRLIGRFGIGLFKVGNGHHQRSANVGSGLDLVLGVSGCEEKNERDEQEDEINSVFVQHSSNSIVISISGSRTRILQKPCCRCTPPEAVEIRCVGPRASPTHRAKERRWTVLYGYSSAIRRA